MINRGGKELGEQPAAVLLRTTRISLEVLQDISQVFAVRSQHLAVIA
jgi:hypothetical protein